MATHEDYLRMADDHAEVAALMMARDLMRDDADAYPHRVADVAARVFGLDDDDAADLLDTLLEDEGGER